MERPAKITAFHKYDTSAILIAPNATANVGIGATTQQKQHA
jgi:hypothetical protein